MVNQCGLYEAFSITNVTWIHMSIVNNYFYMDSYEQDEWEGHEEERIFDDNSSDSDDSK
jgi:hypothetical protein